VRSPGESAGARGAGARLGQAQGVRVHGDERPARGQHRGDVCADSAARGRGQADGGDGHHGGRGGHELEGHDETA